MSNSLQSFGLKLARLLCPRDSPGKNTGVGCYFLLQGIFPTQESNLSLLSLLHCTQILYPLNHQGSPHHILSVQFSHLVVSNSLRPHELQHARPPCPSPSPRVHSNSRPSSRWCHPAISSSVIPFFSCPQSFPASVFSNESTLHMRCPKYWSVSFSISPSKEHPGLISFRMDWLVSLIFLKRSLVFLILLFSSISLHWLLRKAFLSLQAILWNSAFKWAHLSFSPLLLASFLFIATCKASSDSHLSFASDSKQNLFVG